ncbi:MAG: 2-hydroxyacyl-CoA dehydratase [Phycisphaerales bacterium]|nr:MAG: 2-hydroxyacyl-CoA dehydratase [Phycisphaerales bacterium]
MLETMKTIIYTCPYIPAEWIAAHGLHASRIVPDHVDADLSLARAEGVCPYVRSFIGQVMADKEAGGAVLTTVCDQMRRAFDIIVRNGAIPAFLMNVPNTWQTPAAQALYIDELKRLGRFLVQLGGTSPSDEALAEVMLEYDDARTSIRSAREYLSARRFADAIAQNRVCNKLHTLHAEPLVEGVPLALAGGPLMRSDYELFDMVEQLGGRIVLDATETGDRGMCPEFDRARLRKDPLRELARAYFGSIPDASRRPNSDLYEWLERELIGRAVRGIIFRRYLWCDLWHAELGRLKDRIELPVLDIDSAGENHLERPRISNRIRAFLEMLQ